MKTLALFVLISCSVAALPAKAEVAEETRLAALLQSDATPAEKEGACRRLKQMGSAKAVPALAALLGDEHLYQAACDALETMPFLEAGEALRASIRTTSGKPKAGAIHALGERRDQPALPDLANLLSDSDPLVASSSANALRRIGGPEAIRRLREAVIPASDPLRSAIVDALLQCAVQLLTDGDRAGAASIFEQFDAPKEKEHVRTAAYAGRIDSAGDRWLTLVTAGLESSDLARQTAALHVARSIPDPGATITYTRLLTKTSPAMQVALLGLLQQRGDVRAAPAVVSAAQSVDTSVRVAAIAALGTLGDTTAIPILATAATSKEESEQKAGRQALIELRRGNVADALVAQLILASPEAQVELIRALAGRSEKSAVPKLFTLARSDAATTRKAALQAMSRLADGSHLASLVELVKVANDETARADVRSVFESIVERAERKKRFDVTPIVNGLAGANVETRIALLQVSALFADARLRAAFRAGVKDADAPVREAASRALCNSRDVELMPDLLELARNSQEVSLHALALEGYVRLTGDESSGFSAQKRAELLKPAFELTERPEEKRVVLAALAEVAHPDALELAERSVGEDVRNEAEVARLQIAKALLPSAPAVAEKTLQRLATSARTDSVRTNAQAALKQFKTPPSGPR